jgi:hypothetical protein
MVPLALNKFGAFIHRSHDPFGQAYSIEQVGDRAILFWHTRVEIDTIVAHTVISMGALEIRSDPCDQAMMNILNVPGHRL